MKIVQVTYTVQAAYAEQNVANIQTVMNDLRPLNHAGIHYTVCLGPDGKTFIHTAFFQSDVDQKVLLELPSFKRFQEQLKNSGPETPPHSVLLALIDSSVDIFPTQISKK